jgi:hypothetical protein
MRSRRAGRGSTAALDVAMRAACDAAGKSLAIYFGTSAWSPIRRPDGRRGQASFGGAVAAPDSEKIVENR